MTQVNEALVRQMLAGSERAFDAFFELYFPRLFRFAARRVESDDEAEDIVNAAGVDLFAEQAKRSRKGMFRKRKKR